MTRRERQGSRRALGQRAEAAARTYFSRLGLEVLGANVRVGCLEVDLLVRDGPVVAVVEVRTRGATSYQRALDSIDSKKRARVRAAGERLWRERISKMSGVDRVRFDAVAVTFLPCGEVRIEHIKAAF